MTDTPKTVPDNLQEMRKEREAAIIRQIAGFLQDERYRFTNLGDDCLELYLQGKHLTMRMIIYAHNGHLVVRVPEFIRNQNLLFPAFLRTILTIQSEFFDIRFELSEDGQSLSASSNHILEDNTITKSQFNQCLTVVAFIIDQHYPLFLKVLYKEHRDAGEPTNEEEKKEVEAAGETPPISDPPDGHSLN